MHQILSDRRDQPERALPKGGQCSQIADLVNQDHFINYTDDDSTIGEYMLFIAKCAVCISGSAILALCALIYLVV